MTKKANQHFALSGIMETFLHDVKEYETRLVGIDPAMLEAYRFMYFYRLLSSGMLQFTQASWFVQALLETEMSRDNVEIYTADQFDEYVDNFVHKLGCYNPNFKDNEFLRDMIALGFNNIYDAKGFNDEE